MRVEGSKKMSPVLVVILVIGSVAFAVGLTVVIFLSARPRGEKVGEASLTDPNAMTAFEAKAGDSLFFRTDASLTFLRGVGQTSRDRDADEMLRRSKLTIRAVSPAGVEKVATCNVYNGSVATSSQIGPRFARSGMLNDCTIAIDAPGRWTVRGEVVWAPQMTLLGASLETRREALAAR